jgi:hypothetical protein
MAYTQQQIDYLKWLQTQSPEVIEQQRALAPAQTAPASSDTGYYDELNTGGGSRDLTEGGYTQEMLDRYNQLTPEQLASDQWAKFRELSLADKERLGEATPEQLTWLENVGAANGGDTGGEGRQVDVGTPVVDDPFAPPATPAAPVVLPPDGPGGGGPTVPYTGTGGQADTSWNWDAFSPQNGSGEWGGYDEDYQAFERYQPGMDSPWGMPNVEGGNEDFYQQQFVNLLRDEQGYQSRERQAQAERQDAFENPYAAAPTDWSWANGGQGLPSVVEGTGVMPGGERQLGSQYEGLNNQEIFGQVAPQLSDGAKQWFPELFADGAGTNTNWGAGGYDSNIDNATTGGLNAQNQDYMREILGTIYPETGSVTPGGIPVPAGYASPINA